MSTSAPLASSDANAFNNNTDGQKILADLSKSSDDASSLNYSVATDNNNVPPPGAAEENGVVVSSGGLATAAGLAAVNSIDDLANDAANLDSADPLESDVVLTHKSSSSRKLLTSRPVLLLALLAILIIGLSVGLSNRNNNGANATATGGADIEVKAATAAAVPKEDKNEPNKKDGGKEPVPAPIPGTPVPTDQSTPFPTNQGTETVGIDASFGPTTPPRGDEDWRRKNRRVNVIQSPTWHG